MSLANSGGLCLALCSATRTASAALLEGGKLVVEHEAATGLHQAEVLLPLIDRVLRETGVPIDDLAGIGLSIGPGSFTSLRIGVATVKGLAFRTRLPVIAVSTLQALAEASADTESPEMPIVSLMNAQRGEVYAAGFAGPAGDFVSRADILPERVYNAEELAARLPRGCRVVGDGTAIVGERLCELRGDEIRCDEDANFEPSAASIGRLAAPRLREGEGVAAEALAPRYVRRAEAEVTRTQQRFEVPSGA